MKVLCRIIVVYILFFILVCNVYALNDTSKASVVIDADSGRILYDNNKDNKRLIASTTNIMTT